PTRTRRRPPTRRASRPACRRPGCRGRPAGCATPRPGRAALRRTPASPAGRRATCPRQPQRQPNPCGVVPQFSWDHRGRRRTGATLVAMTPRVELLPREGCPICARVHARLAELAAELGFELFTTDVDAAASAGNPGLRAEFGDRLPVILLDGREHSYWDVDE